MNPHKKSQRILLSNVMMFLLLAALTSPFAKASDKPAAKEPAIEKTCGQKTCPWELAKEFTKEQVRGKLVALSESEKNLQANLIEAERSLEQVRTTYGFIDLDRPTHLNPITQRVQRLESIQWKYLLDMAELKAVIEGLNQQQKSPEIEAQLKAKGEKLTSIENVHKALVQILSEAQKSKRTFDQAKVLYKQRDHIRCNIWNQLESVRKEKEKYKLIYIYLEKAQPADITGPVNAATITARLAAVNELRKSLMTDLADTQRAIEQVRTTYGFIDLECDGGIPLVDSKIIDMEAEEDQLRLKLAEIEPQVVKTQESNDANSQLKSEQPELTGLKARLKELDRLLNEARKEKSSFDQARVLYVQRSAIRDERLRRLDETSCMEQKLKEKFDDLNISPKKAETKAGSEGSEPNKK